MRSFFYYLENGFQVNKYDLGFSLLSEEQINLMVSWSIAINDSTSIWNDDFLTSL